MAVYCDNKNCKHNNDMICTADKTYVVDRYCVSARRRPKQENYRQLMHVDKPNCHKTGGKFKSDRVRHLK